MYLVCGAAARRLGLPVVKLNYSLRVDMIRYRLEQRNMQIVVANPPTPIWLETTNPPP